MRASSFRLGCGIALVALLPGCMQVYTNAGSDPVGTTAPQAMRLRADGRGKVIGTLAQRPGAILPGTPYAAIARAVLEGGGFRSVSELRLAWLRGKADELDWLPDLGPHLSLAVLAHMSQSVQSRPERFDTPRKQAERDLALAEIDQAALTLVDGANGQVFEAIGHHLDAEEAHARADLLEAAYRDVASLDWPIARAVAAGLVPAQRLQELRARVAWLRAERVDAGAEAQRARSELAAMGDSRLGGVAGIGAIRELVSPPLLSELQAGILRAGVEAQERRTLNMLFDGLDARRSPEELAALEEAFGYDGEGSEAGDWAPPTAGPRWSPVESTPGDFEIAAVAREREALRIGLGEAEKMRASAVAEAVRARQMERTGQMTAAELLGPLSSALRAQEEEITQRYALARAVLRLAYLRGTLVDGSTL
ncbi:hypothetical protein CEW88_12145 [Alloyangia pacifica]|uniref:TolC family protein n=1 Tax=Alloyangia pacifica TaxID=311180 RepID=A0A2U8HEQ9_9RHOB|nr:hypothetical protein [Alloyangia pacifica]AWI84367.1 hypothetical protein CEW88_12145 [Alloyangia pacifica]